MMTKRIIDESIEKQAEDSLDFYKNERAIKLNQGWENLDDRDLEIIKQVLLNLSEIASLNLDLPHGYDDEKDTK